MLAKDKFFEKDPYFYHRPVSYLAIVDESEKAILFKTITGDFWVPRSLIKDMDDVARTMWLWENYENIKEFTV